MCLLWMLYSGRAHELLGMFDAKEIDFKTIEFDP